MHAREWLKKEGEVADQQPDSNHLHLPWPNRASVFRAFKFSLDFNDMCQTYFLRKWRDDPETQHIEVRKWMRFAQCTTCVQYRDKRGKAKGKSTQDDLDTGFSEHVCFIKREREGYYLRRYKSITNPEDYLSIIIDGADQSRFHLPYHRVVDHSTQGKFKIKLHIHGLLSHGRDVMAYFCLPFLKQGANSTIEIIHRYISKLRNDQDKLPPVLFIQLDNTCRQNKNKYVFGYLGLLVHYGVFTTILVSFLPVGHTHEDIDQYFSCIAGGLYLCSAASRIALKRIVEESYVLKRTDNTGKRVPVLEAAGNDASPGTQKRSTVENMDLCANISDFLEDHVQKVEGISKFYQYRISMAGSGKSRRAVYSRRYDSHMDGRRESQYTGRTAHSFNERIFKNTPATDAFLRQQPFVGVPDAQHESDAARGESADDGEIRLRRKAKHKDRMERDIEKQIEEGDYPPEEDADLREMLKLCTAGFPLGHYDLPLGLLCNPKKKLLWGQVKEVGEIMEVAGGLPNWHSHCCNGDRGEGGW